ncbi:hypothetical protein JKP88DRAFT_315163 [Tribonema minus]|uniref:BSD domain-containing protein n=1 Tax=Tribonema minus TaxID=303371 RepID=A0A835YZ40_9STRA|nr:hypothetical protein JKP88DRAFT_315163 [Tribonema minus]
MAWSLVKDHMVSPATSAKAMIKVNPTSSAVDPMVIQVLDSGLATAADILATARSTILKVLRSYAGSSGGGGGGGGSAAGGGAAGGGKAKSLNGDGGEGAPRGAQSWGAGHKRQRTAGPLSGAGGRALDAAAVQPPAAAADGGAADVAQRRAALLARDAVLRAQYADVVEGGVLSDAEFWAGRRGMLEGEAAAARARRQGARSALGADVRPAVEGAKQVFRLTPRDIHQIFLMYPAVERAYKAKVPVELSEKEFWVKYFQSQYYTRDRGGAAKAGGATISAGDDMFSRFAAEYEEEKRKAAAAAARGGGGGGSSSAAAARGNSAQQRLSGTEGVDPTVDLAAQFSDYHSRPVDDRGPEERAGAADAQAVIERLNRHAALVMRPRAGGGGAPHDDPAAATDLPELHAPAPPPVQPLHLANASRYAGAQRGAAAAEGGGAAAAPVVRRKRVSLEATCIKRARPPHTHTHTSLQNNTATHCSAAAPRVPPQAVQLREPNLARALPPPARALDVLQACTKEAAGAGAGGSAATAKSFPQEFVTQMHRHFQVIGELLRHFYAGIGGGGGGGGSDIVQKQLHRLVTKMGSKYDELKALRQGLPRDAQGSQLSTLIKPLLDSLDDAFENNSTITMAPIKNTVVLAAALVASGADAFAPRAALPTAVARPTTSSLSMAYIPDGLTPEQWKAIKDKEQANAGKNLGVVGTTRFKSRSFEYTHSTPALLRVSGGHLFPVDLSKVKSGELTLAQVPYMMRKDGAWDDSDVADKVPGVQKKAWLPADERYYSGGLERSKSFNLFGTQVNLPWKGEMQPGYEQPVVAPVPPPMPKRRAAAASFEKRVNRWHLPRSHLLTTTSPCDLPTGVAQGEGSS